MAERKVITRWTPDEVKILKNMRDQGKTLAEIAARLGRTKRSVQGMVAALGLPPVKAEPPKPKFRNDKCKTCHYRGRLYLGVICEYQDIMGESRKCPAGNECTKYLRGDPAKSHHKYLEAAENETTGEDLRWLPLAL